MEGGARTARQVLANSLGGAALALVATQLQRGQPAGTAGPSSAPNSACDLAALLGAAFVGFYACCCECRVGRALWGAAAHHVCVSAAYARGCGIHMPRSTHWAAAYHATFWQTHSLLLPLQAATPGAARLALRPERHRASSPRCRWGPAQ